MLPEPDGPRKRKRRTGSLGQCLLRKTPRADSAPTPLDAPGARGRYEALACVMLAGASFVWAQKKPARWPAFSCVLVGDSGIEPLTSTV